METQFDNAHNTTMVTLEDVKVPIKNLIGEENMGFMLILHNFNHERFVIAAGTSLPLSTYPPTLRILILIPFLEYEQ
jgi:hypothetical protein